MTARVREVARDRQGPSRPGERAKDKHRGLCGIALVIGAVSWSTGPLAAASSPGMSDWARSGHSEARLVAMGPGINPATRQAAIEIRLDPGYLTYWREPGDAGLPPTLDTSGSQNVATVSMAFPAPRVIDEGGSTLFGYRDAVTLPLRITLSDPARPAILTADLDYAVCAAICLPGKAALRLALPATTDPAAARIIETAEARVPRPAALGAARPLSVVTVVPVQGASLQVGVRAGPDAALFVEGPEGWFFQAGHPVAAGAGAFTVPVSIAQRPAEGPKGPVPLRFTLVDASGAVDVPVDVDADRLRP